MHKLFLCTLCLMILNGTAPAHAAPCLHESGAVKSDGDCWRALDRTNKEFAIRGIWSGIKSEETSTMISGGERGFQAMNWLSIPSPTTTEDIAVYFDELYGSPANRIISWPNAYILAALKMQSEDDQDRLNLLSFFREHNQLPTSVYIMQVTSPDSFMAYADGDNIPVHVHLAGLTAEGVADRVQWRAKKLLESMSSLNKDCAYGTRTLAHLSYKDDLFDEKGLLNAHVEFYFACDEKANESIRAIDKTLWPNSSDFKMHYLNEIFLNAGLLAPDTHAYPQWSGERRRIREFWLRLATIAEKREYYIHGLKTIDAIEILSVP